MQRSSWFWVCPSCMRDGNNTHSHKNYMNAFSAGDITTVYASEISPKCDTFSLLFCLEWNSAVWGCSLPLSLDRPCMVWLRLAVLVWECQWLQCVSCCQEDTLSVLVKNWDQGNHPKRSSNLEQHTDLRKVLFICLCSVEITLMWIIV